jgi:hypothetical protein
VAWADYDLDGDLDLYLANFMGPDRLFRNEGAGSFSSMASLPLDTMSATRGAAWGDHDNDGDPDIYVSNDAQRNRLLRNDGQSVIEVRFSFPLRYKSHFPQQSGEALRISLHPVRIPSSDLNAAFQREGVVPRQAEDVALDEVIYEGDSEGGPYLILHFTRPVSYEVIPGSDYRSISVVVRSLD